MRCHCIAESLQTSLGFFNFHDTPTWEIYVDGKRVTEFPLNVSSSQRITIKDGVSYIGVVPLPATDLGRDAEVVINAYVPTPDRPEGNMQGVTISNYMLKRDEPLDKDTDWKKVQQAYGGFAIEMSDNTEYRISPIFSSTLPEPHSKRDGKKTPV